MAKDLVCQLLKLEPSERIGSSGNKEGPLSYSSLKAHPFFHGVEFEKLHRLNPPMPQEVILMKRNTKLMEEICSPINIFDDVEEQKMFFMDNMGGKGCEEGRKIELDDFELVKEGKKYKLYIYRDSTKELWVHFVL